MLPVAPRGMRNNNPLNIEHVPANKWLGLADTPSDGRFARFKSMDYGVRAAATLLMRYYDRENLHTVRQIVEKWAPATENNVNAYVAAVCKHSNLPAHLPLDLHDRHTMERLVAAMAKHETGVELDETVLNKGLALAGFQAPMLVSSVMWTPTMVAATSVAAPSALVALGGIIEGLSDQQSAISGLIGAVGGPVAGSVALGVITAATWAWNLYKRLQIRNETGV